LEITFDGLLVAVKYRAGERRRGEESVRGVLLDADSTSRMGQQ
jgi:hypothetical protein